MSDTPRTDALLLEVNEGRVYQTEGPVTELARTLERELAEANERIAAAIEPIERYGGIDGEHHKTWVLDQAVRALLGDKYTEWVAEIKREGFDYDEGIAP